MRPLLLLAALVPLILATASYAGAPSADDLLGTWKVDLRPTPDAPPYYQAFSITSVAGDTLRGSFYGAPLQYGVINRDWGAVRFAFVTADNSGYYATSGVLTPDGLEGTTHATGRGFLSVWTAVKDQD